MWCKSRQVMPHDAARRVEIAGTKMRVTRASSASKENFIATLTSN